MKFGCEILGGGGGGGISQVFLPPPYEPLFRVLDLLVNMQENLADNFIPVCDSLRSQGYARKGAALAQLERFEEAEEAYQQGLEYEPDNKQMKDALMDVETKQCELALGPGLFMGKVAMH